MKLTRIKIILAAAFALAGAFPAGAESNSVPGAANYPQFSQFIAERNIFNPDRDLSNPTQPPSSPQPTNQSKAGAMEFTFVGAMSYEKGLFGFFAGSNSELTKVLVAGGSIAGYTVKAITPSSVKLVGADRREIELKIGDRMRQKGGIFQQDEK